VILETQPLRKMVEEHDPAERCGQRRNQEPVVPARDGARDCS
jgi:hypothetical protein